MMDTITVRQMPFEFPDEIDPVFIEGDPELSFEGMSTGYAMIASSLLLPHLEPYLIRSMKAAAKHVTDPKVLQSLEGFAAQAFRGSRRSSKSFRMTTIASPRPDRCASTWPTPKASKPSR